MTTKELQVGDKAPSFKLKSQDGSTVQLKDFKGKTVILYFYPKDMTSGCTTQACDFSDSSPQFLKKNAVVLGVSKDSIESHQKFINKNNIKITLLSDPETLACEAYGVWKEKSMYGRKYMGIERSTFVISPEGKIQQILRKVKVPGHVKDILQSLSK